MAGVLPHLVIAADWSTTEAKRWMVRAERTGSNEYLVCALEPVGEHTSLIQRLRAQLADALGWPDLSALRRRCERRTATRKAAECLFFTLGGAQVGAGTIVGWRDVIQPAVGEVKLWPFDGELSDLITTPGVTVAEIYPAEAYSHLGVSIGSGTGATKTSRKARQRATSHWVVDFDAGPIRLSGAARSWVEWGFLAEDDFDAMAGLLSMLQIVTRQGESQTPNTSDVRQIEGWILGQTC